MSMLSYNRTALRFGNTLRSPMDLECNQLGAMEGCILRSRDCDLNGVSKITMCIIPAVTPYAYTLKLPINISGFSFGCSKMAIAF